MSIVFIDTCPYISWHWPRPSYCSINLKFCKRKKQRSEILMESGIFLAIASINMSVRRKNRSKNRKLISPISKKRMFVSNLLEKLPWMVHLCENMVLAMLLRSARPRMICWISRLQKLKISMGSFNLHVCFPVF